MSIRTTEKTIVFERPFILTELDSLLPAGDYVVETREERLEDISFPEFLRIQTKIHLHPKRGLMQKLTIDPEKLAAALRRDQAVADTTIDQATNSRRLFVTFVKNWILTTKTGPTHRG